MPARLDAYRREEAAAGNADVALTQIMNRRILPAGKILFFAEGRKTMIPKAQIMDEAAIRRALARIAHEIIERNQGVETVCLFGVKRKGVPLTRLLCENIRKFGEAEVPCGELDVTFHRDDLTDEARKANAGQSYIPCDIRNKTVILVDDVLSTGRTARAAIETVFSCGRPRAVQFVALVDRGHRELPLRPDYVGKNVPTAQNEVIWVQMNEEGEPSGVYICDRQETKE